MPKYEYRHQELYRNVRIDVRAHTSKDLIRKEEKKREEIYNSSETHFIFNVWQHIWAE